MFAENIRSNAPKTGSFTVLYVSLIAHFSQLLFLHWVETPRMFYLRFVRIVDGCLDIEKTYPEMVQDMEEKHKEILYDQKTGYFRKVCSPGPSSEN